MGSGTGKSDQREKKESNESPVVAKGKEQLRVSTVIFVEQSRRGELASKMKETLLGFKMKVVRTLGQAWETSSPTRTPGQKASVGEPTATLAGNHQRRWRIARPRT